MPSWQNPGFFGATVTPSAAEVKTGQSLVSTSSIYSVLDFIGEGCFGKVARCQNLETNEIVAVKIFKDKNSIQDAEKEVSMLNFLSILDPDRANIVKFFERFDHMGQTCLAFEMLDKNLYDLLREQGYQPQSVKQLRPIAKQLLVALDALKYLGVVHTDIKPDNIMLVNRQNQPLRVKLIDFGLAIPASSVQTGTEAQPIGYRAPEVTLGLPYSEAIDVWGVGCVLAYLYLCDNLFAIGCYYQMMKSVVKVLGQPEDHMLCAGIYTQFFFIEGEAGYGSSTWRLMTPEEFTAATNMLPRRQRNSRADRLSSLDDLVNTYPNQGVAELEDREAFVDLLKQLLHLDGDQRISPRRALQHPFITMTHLSDRLYSRAYTTESHNMMSVCPTDDSAHIPDSSLACEPERKDPAEFYDGQPYMFYDEAPPYWTSDEVVASEFSDNVLPLWTSVEVPHSDSNDEESSTGFSDGELPSASYEENPVAWSLDGELVSLFGDEDPAQWSLGGELMSLFCDKDPAQWSLGGELTSVLSEEHPAAMSSVGGTSTDLTAAASASPTRTKKWLRRIRKFFKSLCCCCSATVED